jgi:uncharacterized LabA/DUF88 family protein
MLPPVSLREKQGFFIDHKEKSTMGRTVVFVDGEYVRKIFHNKGHRLNVPKLITHLLSVAKIEEDNLLRVYYYTTSPYQSSNPTPDEKARYQNFQKFLNFLSTQDSFEIKLGRLEKRGNDFEQKMVDVLLSIDLVELSAKSKIETAILVAGDSDFVPAVQKAKDNGVRVILCCSADKKEYHAHLWNHADKRIPLDESFMQHCEN